MQIRNPMYKPVRANFASICRRERFPPNSSSHVFIQTVVVSCCIKCLLNLTNDDDNKWGLPTWNPK